MSSRWFTFTCMAGVTILLALMLGIANHELQVAPTVARMHMVDTLKTFLYASAAGTYISSRTSTYAVIGWMVTKAHRVAAARVAAGDTPAAHTVEAYAHAA
jgi:hypothetical protein